MSCKCVLNNTSDTSGLPTLNVVERGKKTFDITLKDSPCDDAEAIDLSDAASVWFITKQSRETRKIYINKEAEIIDPYTGQISITLDKEDLKFPGLFYGCFVVKDEEGTTIDQFACWLFVRKAVDSPFCVATLTIPEVRAFLVDRCASDNLLLDATQFTDDQIMDSMRIPVEEWNDTPPSIQRFTTVTFPFRYAWLMGTAAYLLTSISIQQFRNNATYQAGTVTVNDSDKGPQFKAIGDQLMEQWHRWLYAKKRELNVRAGWGITVIGDF